MRRFVLLLLMPLSVDAALLVAPAGNEDGMRAAVAAHGGHSRGRLYGMDVHLVDVPAGQERAIVRRLAGHPHIRFAEVDERVELSLTVNDPYYGSQWHLPKINAPTAWDASTGGNVTIAILDTGTDPHPDLSLVAGWNFYDNNSNTADVHGHGTAVAGTAAAIGNNAEGVAGVAWSANIMPMRISDTSGYGYWSAVAQALNWSADNGARVANISYMVSGSSTVQQAASYFRSRGGVVAAAAGNTGGDAGMPNTGVILTVSATDSNDVRASWSTYGAVVDIAAPGVGIVTTARGGWYTSGSGTSFAAPIVAGVAALVIARRPDLTATQIEEVLLLSATDLGAVGNDPYYGAGRVDAAAAVQRAIGITIEPAPPTPKPPKPCKPRGWKHPCP